MPMESLWKLLYLLEPAPLTLILTAIAVTFGSAFRALNHGKAMERNRDLLEASITLDQSQALMIPIMSSCSLLLMFYLFSSVSQLLTAFTAIASVSSLFFCLSPYLAYVKSQFNLADPFVSRCCSKSFTRIQGLLLITCVSTVVAWLISGHWILNNLLGISICIAFVSHVRLPNIKICAILLLCLFFYDIFWVFYSERFFGANVMVSVATQQASNPVHTVANSLSLPGLQLITKKLELPVKIMFPRNLLGGVAPQGSTVDYMMLGLGDMVCNLSLSLFKKFQPNCSVLSFPGLLKLSSPPDVLLVCKSLLLRNGKIRLVMHLSVGLESIYLIYVKMCPQFRASHFASASFVLFLLLNLYHQIPIPHSLCFSMHF